MKTKHKILFAIIVGIVIAAILLVFVGGKSDTKTEKDYYKTALEVWVADPDSITVTADDSTNITEQFFGKYGEKILDGEYREALDEMRENNYEYEYVVTWKNKDINEAAKSELGNEGIGREFLDN